MPFTLGPMLHALPSSPSAMPDKLPYALCPMPHALCPMPYFALIMDNV
jgi:hypothetical protein